MFLKCQLYVVTELRNFLNKNHQRLDQLLKYQATVLQRRYFTIDLI